MNKRENNEKDVDVVTLKGPLKLNLPKAFEIEYRVNTDDVLKWEIFAGALYGLNNKEVSLNTMPHLLEEVVIRKISLPIGKWIIKSIDYHEITLIRDI